LADAYGPRGTAIVLSGADGDGAIGIRRVKERGGLSIAQDPLEAEHGGMPRAAIATGVVDLVLPVGAMAGAADHLPPPRTPASVATRKRARAAAGAGAGRGCRRGGADPGAPPDEDADRPRRGGLQAGHGAAPHRPADAGQRGPDAADYLEVLRTRAGESRALLKDLFVSVTNFFRDAEHFEALAAQIPALFDGKAPTETVRVWVPGCATGEEAYSIAILLHEAASRLECPPRLRVFASDLDADAIQVGRTGFYPSTIAADVSPERLGRFFSAAPHGYRICAELRETVLFATHDVLTDSPFSRVDLVSCRNLLIYFERALRERVLETFHFALRPTGCCFWARPNRRRHPIRFSTSSTGSTACSVAARRRGLVYALPVGASGRRAARPTRCWPTAAADRAPPNRARASARGRAPARAVDARQRPPAADRALLAAVAGRRR
jgi:two-component system CheB/CheR fusion protein